MREEHPSEIALHGVAEVETANRNITAALAVLEI